MPEITVNSAIELVNTLRGRVNDLNILRDQNATIERSWHGEEKTEKEPLYDLAEVDEKMVMGKNAIRKLNTAIKESNSRTKINVDVNEDSLLAPVKSVQK